MVLYYFSQLGEHQNGHILKGTNFSVCLLSKSAFFPHYKKHTWFNLSKLYFSITNLHVVESKIWKWEKVAATHSSVTSKNNMPKWARTPCTYTCTAMYLLMKCFLLSLNFIITCNVSVHHRLPLSFFEKMLYFSKLSN